MLKLFALLCVALLTTVVSSLAHAADAKSPLDFKMKDIEGQEVDLGSYKGKVVLIVNVASQCGLTPQYGGLEALYERYGDKGLVILGFPANEFGKQEPGTDGEIREFCTTNYGVKFPMFSKIVVKGGGMHPLYQYLTKNANPKFVGEVSWTFEKFLVDRLGNVVARFTPKVAPESADLIKAVETELAKQ